MINCYTCITNKIDMKTQLRNLVKEYLVCLGFLFLLHTITKALFDYTVTTTNELLVFAIMYMLIDRLVTKLNSKKTKSTTA